MLTALLLTAVALPGFTYGVYRLERWSNTRAAEAARVRAEDAVFTTHPGADERFVVELRAWLAAGQGSAVAR